jgi:hypothetical protein
MEGKKCVAPGALPKDETPVSSLAFRHFSNGTWIFTGAGLVVRGFFVISHCKALFNPLWNK